MLLFYATNNVKEPKTTKKREVSGEERNKNTAQYST